MLAEHTTVTMTPEARRVTSARKIEANRRNARDSTGPITAAGKTRAAQNARRHGLNLPARYDPSRAGEIDALARAIAGADAQAERLEIASRIAAAQIDVERARRARLDIYPQALSDRDAIARLAAIDRYEGRALSLRKRAMCDYADASDGAHSGTPAGISAKRSHQAKMRRMAGSGGLGLAGVSFKLSSYAWAGPEAAWVRSLIRATMVGSRVGNGGCDVVRASCKRSVVPNKRSGKTRCISMRSAIDPDRVRNVEADVAHPTPGSSVTLAERSQRARRRSHAARPSERAAWPRTPRGNGCVAWATAAATLPTHLASAPLCPMTRTVQEKLGSYRCGQRSIRTAIDTDRVRDVEADAAHPTPGSSVTLAKRSQRARRRSHASRPSARPARWRTPGGKGCVGCAPATATLPTRLANPPLCPMTRTVPGRWIHIDAVSDRYGPRAQRRSRRCAPYAGTISLDELITAWMLRANSIAPVTSMSSAARA